METMTEEMVTEEDEFEPVSQEDDEEATKPKLVPAGTYQLALSGDSEKVCRKVRANSGVLYNVIDIYIKNPPQELDGQGRKVNFETRMQEWINLKSASNMNGRQRAVKLINAFGGELPTGRALSRADYEEAFASIANATTDLPIRIKAGTDGYDDKNQVVLF